jgi:hypothetical protein
VLARSSPAFAVLAAVGAGRIAGDLAAVITFALGVLMRPEVGPLPYQVREVIGPAVAIVVAARAAGRRAVIGYVAYAGLIVSSRWLAQAISCARIDREPLVRVVHCEPSVVDRLGAIAPLLVGLAVGVVVARAIATAPRRGSNALFEAAGAYTAVPAILTLGTQAFVYEPPHPPPGLLAYAVGTTVVGALLAGVVCARRSAAPVRTALLAAGLLLAAWLYPLGLGQLTLAAGVDLSERPEMLTVAMPVLGALVLVGAAALGRRRKYDLSP